jgi:hypothetical protein
VLVHAALEVEHLVRVGQVDAKDAFGIGNRVVVQNNGNIIEWAVGQRHEFAGQKQFADAALQITCIFDRGDAGGVVGRKLQVENS